MKSTKRTAHLSDVDASVEFTSVVFLSQLSNHFDRIESSILRKSVWNNLEKFDELDHETKSYLHSFSISLKAITINAADFFGALAEFERKLAFNCSSTSDKSSLLDKTSEDAKGVVD